MRFFIFILSSIFGLSLAGIVFVYLSSLKNENCNNRIYIFLIHFEFASQPIYFDKKRIFDT